MQVLPDRQLPSTSSPGNKLIYGTRDAYLLSNNRVGSRQDANDGPTTIHVRSLSYHPRE